MGATHCPIAILLHVVIQHKNFYPGLAPGNIMRPLPLVSDTIEVS